MSARRDWLKARSIYRDLFDGKIRLVPQLDAAGTSIRALDELEAVLRAQRPYLATRCMPCGVCVFIPASEWSGNANQVDGFVAGACFGATKTDVVCFSLECILERMIIPGICGKGHLLMLDNLKVDQAKRRWRCRRCGRARAAEFRARHKPAA